MVASNRPINMPVVTIPFLIPSPRLAMGLLQAKQQRRKEARLRVLRQSCGNVQESCLSSYQQAKLRYSPDQFHRQVGFSVKLIGAFLDRKIYTVAKLQRIAREMRSRGTGPELDLARRIARVLGYRGYSC
jgi:hypothetical protein